MGRVHKRQNGTPLSEWVEQLPEVFASNSAISADVSRALRQVLVRKIGSRIYTTNLVTPVEEIIASRPLEIAGLRFPDAVISHRSAFEMRPVDGVIFLTGAYEKTDELPGLKIRLIQGPGPLDGDMRVGHLYRASNARAFLENLRRTRATPGVSRALSRVEIERKLEQELRHVGERGLNALRDQARALALLLDAGDAFDVLDEIVGALLRTRTTKLTAPTAVARADGQQYDPDRLAMFEVLRDELADSWRETSRPAPALLRDARQNATFFEAYFSNFIEGTRFEVEEAQRIVFDGLIPVSRPADAHDVLGTYELLLDASDRSVSGTEFESPEDFENLLKRRHCTIMQGRPEVLPGEFKEEANRAGNTVFVKPDLVRGTLARGFEILKTLHAPFQRAAFVMFLVAEVHPFNDGNGRLARAMMNAELSHGDQVRMLIVTGFREDYLMTLRRLSRNRMPNAYVRMLDRAQEYSSRLNYEDFDGLFSQLEQTNAFDDTGQRRLRMPDEI